MAQKVMVSFTCDYDAKDIPAGQERRRTFGMDGKDYEIDLCSKHSTKLDEVFGKFTGHARRVAFQGVQRRRRTVANRQRSADVRAWAKKHGRKVNERGRIPADVVADYEKANA